MLSDADVLVSGMWSQLETLPGRNNSDGLAMQLSELQFVLLLSCSLASSAYIVSSVAKVSKYDYVYQGIDETQFGQQQEFVTAMKQ